MTDLRYIVLGTKNSSPASRLVHVIVLTEEALTLSPPQFAGKTRQKRPILIAVRQERLAILRGAKINCSQEKRWEAAEGRR